MNEGRDSGPDELQLAAAPSGRPLSVTQLNAMARQLVERSLPLLWVAGEISNFTRAASGHCYFSLKDERAQVRCVLFRSRAQGLDWMPGNGMQVEVRAAPGSVRCSRSSPGSRSGSSARACSTGGSSGRCRGIPPASAW